MRILILVLMFVCGVSAQVTFNQPKDTFSLVASVNNATAYQWYDNGSIWSGKTDSVCKFVGDSAFYSKTHTIYCLTSNSAGSLHYGDWTIKNKQIAFRRKY